MAEARPDPLGEVADLPTPATQPTTPQISSYSWSSSIMGQALPYLQKSVDIGEKGAQRIETFTKEAKKDVEGIKDLAKEHATEREKARPTAPTLPPPTVAARPFLEPGPSVLGSLQGIMQGIGLLALGITGTKGRGYAYAATAALKGAAEGWQQGDNERVKRELAIWQSNHRQLMDEYQLQRDAFNDILTNQKTTMDNRLSELRMRAEILHLDDLADKARQGNIAAIIDYFKTLDVSQRDTLTKELELRKFNYNAERIERDHRDLQAQRAKSNDLRERALGEQAKTRSLLIRKAELAELEPFKKAGRLADGLNEIESIYSKLESEHPDLVPKSGELFDAWQARIQRALSPGDTRLYQMKLLWNSTVVGLFDRGWADEKGVRALAVFQPQLNVQDQMPPPEALHTVMRSMRGLVRKGVDRDIEARRRLGASPEEMALANMFVETLHDPEDATMLQDIKDVIR